MLFYSIAFYILGGGSATVIPTAATSASLENIAGVCGSNTGSIFFTLTSSSTRRVDLATGIVYPFIGTPGNQGSSGDGDGGQSTSALQKLPQGCTVDTAGNLYMASFDECTIRMVSASTNVIKRVAGTGSSSVGSRADGPATSAIIVASSVFVDTVANLFIPETSGNKVFKVTSNGALTTFAGAGGASYNGDCRATSANFPGTAMRGSGDALGNFFIMANNRVLRVDGTTTILAQIAGRRFLFCGFIQFKSRFVCQQQVLCLAQPVLPRQLLLLWALR
jgi:hypothetical protein